MVYEITINNLNELKVMNKKIKKNRDVHEFKLSKNYKLEFDLVIEKKNKNERAEKNYK